MAEKAGQGGKQGGENDLAMMILVIIIFGGGGYMFWHFFGEAVTSGFRWLRIGEMWIVNIFVRSAELEDIQRYLTDLPREELIWTDHITPSTAAVMQYLKWPLSFAMFGFAFFAYVKAPGARFRTTFNMENFIKIQQKTWPVISPIVSFKPSSVSAREAGEKLPAILPPFAEALSIEEWMSWNHIPYEKKDLDKERAAQCLATQVGPKWTGFEGLPLHCRALCAAFALKGARKRKEADDFLGTLATHYTVKNGFVLPDSLERKINTILNDPKMGADAAAIAGKHAFRTTAILGMLEWARERGGVTASSYFVWLRAHDRALWYPLNALGRNTFFPESAGAMVHYKTEKAVGRAILSPKVDAAIIALEKYLKTEKPTLPLTDSKPPEENKTL